jgi:methylated-DNA-[protein]-cysteine S-methyltransferase
MVVGENVRPRVNLPMRYRTIESPIGPLLLAADDQGVRFLLFSSGRHTAGPKPEWEPDGGSLKGVAAQLTSYFAGKRRAFDIPLAPEGTPFQQQVWRALCDIPYGTTTSYAELARRIGNPKAVRAVGLANGSNPISIIIPCHRVIGSNGSLTGYGGGLPIKKALLDLERGQTRLETGVTVDRRPSTVIPPAAPPSDRRVPRAAPAPASLSSPPLRAGLR